MSFPTGHCSNGFYVGVVEVKDVLMEIIERVGI